MYTIGTRQQVQQTWDLHFVYILRARYEIQKHLIYVLCTELELGTQYTKYEIHIFSTASELGTQYKNPEIYI